MKKIQIILIPKKTQQEGKRQIQIPELAFSVGGR